jgi:hypothetical protein
MRGLIFQKEFRNPSRRLPFGRSQESRSQHNSGLKEKLEAANKLLEAKGKVILNSEF